MGLMVITLILITIGVVSYFVGAIKLAKYGFRLGKGTGFMVIFFPPYTFYFALKKLEVDGKGLPTAMVTFGLILSALLISIFAQPLGAFVTGDMDRLNELTRAEIVQSRHLGTTDAAAAAAAAQRDAPAPEASAEEPAGEEPTTEEASDEASEGEGASEGEETEEAGASEDASEEAPSAE